MTDSQQTVTIVVVAALVALGALVCALGVVRWLASRRLARACTACAPGRVVEVVDRGPGSGPARAGRQEEVVAANEAIAAKQRAYREKRRQQARRESREGLATWHVVVEWTPQGADAPVRTEGRRGNRFRAYRPGQLVDVCHDPSDPTRWYLRQEGVGGALGPTLVAAGAALVALGVICWFAFPWVAASSL